MSTLPESHHAIAYELCFTPVRMQLHDNGLWWFMYETFNEDPKDNFSLYCDIQHDLKNYGFTLADFEIEHDCIHGYITLLDRDNG